MVDKTLFTRFPFNSHPLAIFSALPYFPTISLPPTKGALF